MNDDVMRFASFVVEVNKRLLEKQDNLANDDMPTEALLAILDEAQNVGMETVIMALLAYAIVIANNPTVWEPLAVDVMWHNMAANLNDA
jgi:hypothetical protein